MKSTNHPLFISILALTYPHFSFVLCSSFVRHLFVLCSSFVRLTFFVTTLPLLGRGLGRGYFVRLFFTCPCGSHRLLFVTPSSHFSVTTLPLLGRSLRIGEYVIGERIFCSSLFHFCVATFPLFEEASESWVCVRGRFPSSFHYLPVVLRLPVWLTPARVARTVFPISSLYLHYFILPSPFANFQIC